MTLILTSILIVQLVTVTPSMGQDGNSAIAFFSNAATQQGQQQCRCGIENRGSPVASRIINGKPVPPKKYPWMVNLLMELKDGSGSACTGSIINDRFVLTAGHCVEDAKRVQVFHCAATGETCIDKLHKTPSLPVKRFFHHPQYESKEDPFFIRNDIALIELARPFKFSQGMSPVCLTFDTTFDNWFSAGWGKQNVRTGQTPSGQDLADTNCLREAQLRFWDRDRCRHFVGAKWEPKKVICAGDVTGTCSGDSGGPLMTRKGGKVFQAGITSYGNEDCGTESGFQTPSVFEAIFIHKEWIRQQTQGAVWCN